MPIELIQRVIKSAHGHGLEEIIPSTMGEPLLYKHFDEILDLARKYELKVNLTTNGTFPRLGPEGWGEKVLPLASDVKISINGFTKDVAENIMVGIDHDQHLSNIQQFIRVRDKVRNGNASPSVTFQATYMESNLQDLPGLLKMAISMGADRFKGHHLWETHPALNTESLRRNQDSKKRWNETAEILQDIASSTPLPNGGHIQLANVFPEVLDECSAQNPPTQLKCPFLGREAWIAWDGTFNVCCSPDDQRRQFGSFGNVNDTNFMDLWRSQNYQNLIKGWGNHSVCAQCNMKRPEGVDA